MILLRTDRFTKPGPANRNDLIVRMAADLRRVGIPADERETIRALCSPPLSYRHVDVAALAEEALFAARQGAVGDTMGSDLPPPPPPAKASQAPLPETVPAAPGSARGGGLLSMLALESPLTWRDPGAGR